MRRRSLKWMCEQLVSVRENLGAILVDEPSVHRLVQNAVWLELDRITVSTRRWRQ
jgi:hypothetical protein